MTLPGYVAWGYILYGMLNPPPAESVAELSADGAVKLAKGCRIYDVKIENGVISFTREDEFLPIMPAVALPPRAHVPITDGRASSGCAMRTLLCDRKPNFQTGD
jgi:hypothetical protein